MDLRVLGTVEASDGDQPVAIGAGKPRAVLAMLALSEGTPISAGDLIDGLWGEAPPATAPKMVQGYVSHLRKAFAAVGNGAEIGIIGAAITRGDRTLATGSATGAVQLWDIRSGQALGAPLPGVPSSGVIPAFTPDGSRLVATYASGRAYVWDIRPSSLVRQACRVAGRRLTRQEWAEFLPGRVYAPAC
jgi:hypothetical protein